MARKPNPEKWFKDIEMSVANFLPATFSDQKARAVQTRTVRIAALVRDRGDPALAHDLIMACQPERLQVIIRSRTTPVQNMENLRRLLAKAKRHLEERGIL